jgi:hypothetical protein
MFLVADVMIDIVFCVIINAFVFWVKGEEQCLTLFCYRTCMNYVVTICAYLLQPPEISYENTKNNCCIAAHCNVWDSIEYRRAGIAVTTHFDRYQSFVQLG